MINKINILYERNALLSNRVDYLADREANSAMFGGPDADGRLQPIKDDLIKRSNDLLDEIDALLKGSGNL